MLHVVSRFPLAPSVCSGGLQSLSFCDNFNQSVEGIELPAGLQSLKFGGCFNQKIDKVRGKPSSLMGKYQKKKKKTMFGFQAIKSSFRYVSSWSCLAYMAVCTTVPKYFCCSMFL